MNITPTKDDLALMVADEIKEEITLEQFKKERPARAEPSNASPQLTALRNMAVNTAMILDHTGLQCRQAQNPRRSCSLQGIMQKVAKETNSIFRSYHRPDGRMAVAKFSKVVITRLLNP